jgi:DNA-binding transcriptional regulator YiaG
MKKPKFRSEVAAAVHEGVRGMHRLGLADKKKMREFEVRCLASIEGASPEDVREP